jgi:phosphopantothenoylcysteine decarboxylase / phosphopantothenate---cysteine ligase
MRVLISAGPTQEPLDDIRYITNHSSGKMGLALAEEARKRSYDVTLVMGPVSIDIPENIKTIRVVTADDMLSAVLKELSSGAYDVFISAAAVADFTPEKKRDGKIKSGSHLILDLKPTPKILAEVRKRYPRLLIAGFKAESGLKEKELIEIAKNRLFYGLLDLVVANDVSRSVFGSEENEVYIVTKEGVKKLPRKQKSAVAKDIWNELNFLLHYKK